jgi:hypothetical protein
MPTDLAITVSHSEASLLHLSGAFLFYVKSKLLICSKVILGKGYSFTQSIVRKSFNMWSKKRPERVFLRGEKIENFRAGIEQFVGLLAQQCLSTNW